jgi:L-lysine 2,3-aminomutase
MITRTEPACQAKQPSNDPETAPLFSNDTWQKSLANIIRDPQELFEILELDPDHLPAAIKASQDFALKVPRSFVARMKKGDWNDPLLQQVLPVKPEMDLQPGFTTDPLAEAESNPYPGLIHKYHGRVLLVVSGGCAVNCRYCFRRHFPYNNNNPSQAQWQQALSYIADNNTIREVILSGGDPLAASDKLLSNLVDSIAKIAHISTLRIHTRLPVVIPERITEPCIDWMTSSHLRTVVVIHANHANELDSGVHQALQRLQSAGITLLNQTVLLAGINDNTNSLTQLSERLFEMGVLPYYLHLLDKVRGASHFEVPEIRAKQLMAELLKQLPGYLVPKLVREQAGAKSKHPIHPL